MSRWNIAAAQYAPRHNCVDEHVKHHLHFIAEAASAWVRFDRLSGAFAYRPEAEHPYPHLLTICSLPPSFTPPSHVSSR